MFHWMSAYRSIAPNAVPVMGLHAAHPVYLVNILSHKVKAQLKCSQSLFVYWILIDVIAELLQDKTQDLKPVLIYFK